MLVRCSAARAVSGWGAAACSFKFIWARVLLDSRSDFPTMCSLFVLGSNSRNRPISQSERRAMSRTIDGPDGRPRCAWSGATPEYQAYHDREWGFPVSDDIRLFEKLSLEGFQSGLSWRTILTKRENFRAAFDGFDFARV